jgi:hypothetical protein
MASIAKTKWIRRGIVLGVAVAIAAGGYWRWRVVQHDRYLSSLSTNPPQAFAAMQQGKISDAEFRQAMEPRVQMWQQRVEHYFEIPEGPQRQKYLDGLIDEIERRRTEAEKEMAKSSGPTTRPTMRPSFADMQQRMAARMQSMPPQKRAQMAEFVAAVMKRRIERGMPTDFGPGRGFAPASPGRS